MEERQDQEKHENATPYKLEQARKQGNVAKSTEVASAAAIGIAMLGAYAFTDKALASLSSFQTSLITFVTLPTLTVKVADHLLSTMLISVWQVLAPFLFALICAGILANVIQTGPILSAEPLKFDVGRLNLTNGFKRIFSLRVLFDLAKSAVKLIFLAAILYATLKGQLKGLAQTLFTPIDHFPKLFSHFAGALLFRLFMAMVLIAVVDFLFSRWQFLRKMRMSKRELQDEHKHREGDPRLRKRMRELQREMSKRAQALKGVPEASVIVTNPTRVAIAIRYDSKSDHAPRLIAKGAGEMARHIRAIANRHRIPIVHSPRLARALYRQVDFDQYVPEEWHPLMARVLVWIARKNATGAGVAPR